jgi:hypothetical protein
MSSRPRKTDNETQVRHDQAQARGEAMYLDPHSGLYVMCAAALRARGKCCGNGCRHCPYSEPEQRAAGRPRSSPSPS